MERGEYALVIRHRYGYEVQATAKLFVPGVRFLLVEDGAAPDVPHVIETAVTDGAQGRVLTVDVRLHGQHVTRETTLPSAATDSETEYALCSLLYEVLQQITGRTPPWGMLTGIRPVRRLLVTADGGSLEDAADRMQARYHISEEKKQLMLETARVQRPILPHSPRQVGLYIAVPFCPTRCSYCSFVSHSIEQAGKLIPGYVEKLCEELRYLGGVVKTYGLDIQSVYIGGGTPTTLSPDQLRQVMAQTAESFDLSGTREYTVEAGRADTITEDKLRVIREMGATRISVNPQTMQDSVLTAIGRRHTAAQVVEAYQTARALGFDDINMDLIAGLPTDTLAGFTDTLDQVMALAPDSITVHTLTVKRAARLYQTDEAQMRADEVTQMAALSAARLPAAGWRPYYLYRQKNTLGDLENVGYAKPGKENLYNILIMDETQTILAAGCAASTKLVEPGGDITRVMNYKFPYEYIGRFDAMMQKKREIEPILARMTGGLA
ncbi:MAG: coproporphyrinogen dehydrogenase HemZ [Oscillospiraceae bacterium]|nr:coproporphyrinogen dehydrogenase HemZ [Oscillospiraceae bacterium]